MGVLKDKGFYNSYRVTTIPSRYHHWFVELGYQELDIMEYDDGSWEIIQYLNSPIMPALTRFQTVLGYMCNVIPTFGFCEKYTKKLDITKRAFWAREEAKSKKAEDEHEALQKHKDEFATKAHEAITKNPTLMSRIADKGLTEMNLDKLVRHVPKSEYIKPKYKGENLTLVNTVKEDAANVVCNSSKPA